MQILFSSLLLCGWGISVMAAGPVTPRTAEVTVYRSGAKLSSVASVKVPAGASEVVFENLSPYFNGNSLQVKIKGDARLNTAVFQLKTPGPAPENPRAQVLRDSLVILGDDAVRLNNEREVLNEEIDMIRKNQSRVATTVTGQTTSLTVGELRELTTYYTQRLAAVKERLLQLTIGQRALNTRQQRMKDELSGLQPNTAGQTGEIVLKIDAASPQTLDITCTYLVDNAGWTPLYDLRATGLDKPLQLAYKANVHNSTGFNWKSVTLHLSTAQPLANNDRPILNPVFVDFRPVAYYRQQADDQAKLNVYQMEQVATAPAAPNIYVDGIRVGGEAPHVDELVVVGQDDESDFLTVFDLPNPQDILADGKENIILVEEREVPADFEYHTVPKVDPAVFLLARVANYGQYNLMPGTANIFYQDTYVGQTWVNPQTTADTLLLSLGRDEQLSIKRVQPRDFKERRKIFGSKIRESFEFEISVKNNKSVPVTVTVLDQVPVSRQKDITVSLDDRGGAEYNADFGKLEWQVEIPAHQNKKVRFGYSIEHPKDKPLGYFKG